MRSRAPLVAKATRSPETPSHEFKDAMGIPTKHLFFFLSYATLLLTLMMSMRSTYASGQTACPAKPQHSRTNFLLNGEDIPPEKKRARRPRSDEVKARRIAADRDRRQHRTVKKRCGPPG